MLKFDIMGNRKRKFIIWDSNLGIDFMGLQLYQIKVIKKFLLFSYLEVRTKLREEKMRSDLKVISKLAWNEIKHPTESPSLIRPCSPKRENQN